MQRQGKRGAGLNAIARGGLNSLAPLQRFQGYGRAGLWCSWLGLTLNGNDVSALADQVGTANLSAAGANQPLAIGAPLSPSGARRSIQYTVANSDRLESAAVNLIGTNPCTLVSFQKVPSSAATQFFFAHTNGGGTGIGFGNRVPQRDFVAAGVAARIDAAIGTAAPEIWIGRDNTTTNPKCELLVNGTNQALSPNTTSRTDPGAAAVVTIGSVNGGTLCAPVESYLHSIFTTRLPDDVSMRISRGGGALLGVAIA